MHRDRVGWGKGGGKTGCVRMDRGGEGCIIPHCRGTWAEVEGPLFKKAADVGGNGYFICMGVHARTGRVEEGEKAESLL